MTARRKAPAFHAVLLAGGSGTRFWPLSRTRRPKQFLDLVGGGPLIVQAWTRVRRVAPPRRIWVAAPTRLATRIGKVLPGLRKENLILEPSPRDTAPAVGLACATVEEREPGAVVGVFPTDHVIRDPEAFAGSVRAAVEAATRGALVCLGIKPDRPATGFGYLRCARRPRGVAAIPVERFVEKPDARTARRYLRSGQYLWNAGMFVWRAARFLEELERLAPATARAVRSVVRGRKAAWTRAERLSVDYAVMEKAEGVEVVPLDAGWDDVGSWEAAARLREGSGGGEGKAVLIDSDGALVFGKERLVALVGLPEAVVVDTPDALLVVPRDQSERVREIVQRLRERGMGDLL